jgi:hypothetical protein
MISSLFEDSETDDRNLHMDMRPEWQTESFTFKKGLLEIILIPV